jgi:hypothetical protein
VPTTAAMPKNSTSMIRPFLYAHPSPVADGSRRTRPTFSVGKEPRGDYCGNHVCGRFFRPPACPRQERCMPPGIAPGAISSPAGMPGEKTDGCGNHVHEVSRKGRGGYNMDTHRAITGSSP